MMRNVVRSEPKRVKTIRRWCIATRKGNLIENLRGDILMYKTADTDARDSDGERAVLIEIREVKLCKAEVGRA